MPPSSRVTRWLMRTSHAGFCLYAATAGFLTYLSVYAFRKPITAGQYEGEWLWGVQLKTALVIGQLLGVVISKYLGIKICSEASRASRARLLVLLVAIALVALAAFALLPVRWKPVAMFINGLPLGITWGLLVRYLEGRRFSDLLLATASASFIVGTGIVKDAGRIVIEWGGVSERWMPFATGAGFLPLFLLSVGMLDRLPEPTPEEEAMRSPRRPMDRAARVRFAREFGGGLAALIVTYSLLSACRDFRDNYAVEILAASGTNLTSGVFTRIEAPTALAVLAVMASITIVRDDRRAMKIMYVLMFAGLCTILLATAGWRQSALSATAWLTLVGFGAYLAYVPFNAMLFDRLVGSTSFAGTAVFAVYACDASGYTVSALFQIMRDRWFGPLNHAVSLEVLCNFTACAGLLLLGGSYFFLARRFHRPLMDAPNTSIAGLPE